MRLARLHPSAGVVDLDDVDARSRLADWYRPPGREWVRVNLVTGVGGSVVGPDGTSGSLTAGADRVLLGVIRRLADVVLVGAASVRREGYVLPAHASLAVVSGSGDLTGHRIPADAASDRLLVLCPAAALDSVSRTLPQATAVVVDDVGGRMPAGTLVDALRLRGLTSIVAEGGPSLVNQLLDARLVDELCVTTSPVVGGRMVPAFDSASASLLRLSQLMRDDADAVYARWAVQRDRPGR